MVCLQHLLSTTGSLFEKFIKLGLRPQDTFVLGKVYSANPDVTKRLRSLSFQTFESRTPRSWGSYETELLVEVESMWDRAVTHFRKSSVRQVVVLDDGGCVLASVPVGRLDFPVTGVEQTMSGLAFQDAGRVHVPVVQVAASAAKKLIEPNLIQDAIFNRLSAHKAYLEGSICGVVGLGNIGRAVLETLLKHHPFVFVFDIVDSALLEDLPSGAVACKSLKELLEKSNCVFGCTGRDLFEGNNWWQGLSGKRTLLSCSSHDTEFKSILTTLNNVGFTSKDKLADTTVSTHRGELLLVRGGFPVNFDGSLESVPAQDIQLTRALLMGGVLQAAERNTQLDEGYQPVILRPDLQIFIVNDWLRLVPFRKKDYAPEVINIFEKSSTITDQSAGGDQAAPETPERSWR